MIQPPFVVVEKSGDISFYRHSFDLVRDLEPIDVKNGEYEIYDRSGAVVVPMVDSILVRSRPFFFGGDLRREAVLLRPWPGPAAPDALALALNRALDATPGAPDDRPAELAKLIQLAASTLGYSPQRAFWNRWGPIEQFYFFQIVGFAGIFAIAAAALTVGNSWLVVGGVIWFLLCAWRAGESECSNCGRPLSKSFQKVPWITQLFLPDRCSGCGASLAGEEEMGSP